MDLLDHAIKAKTLYLLRYDPDNGLRPYNAVGTPNDPENDPENDINGDSVCV